VQPVQATCIVERRNEVPRVRFKAVVQADAIGEPGSDDCSACRWLGSKGVVTPAHYDEMHNVFVQLHGMYRLSGSC